MSTIADMQDAGYTSGMSEALGIYLKSLREGQNLEVKDVLAQLGTRLGRKIDPTRLWRAENGKAWPDGDFLTVLADILHARLEDLSWFQQNPGASAEEGRKRAQSALTTDERNTLLALADTDDKRARLLRRIAQLTENPEFRARIEGYLDGLEGEARQ